MRFRIESDENCADLIWHDALAEDRQAPHAAAVRNFVFGTDRFLRDAAAAPAAASPSDWFMIYAISQALVQPEFCGGNVKLRRLTRDQFLQRVISGVLYRRKLQKMPLRLVLEPNPSQVEMHDIVDTLTQHGRHIRSVVTDIVNEWRREHRGGNRPVQVFGRPDCIGPNAIVNLRAAMVADLIPAIVPYEALDERLDRRGWLEAPSGFGGEPFQYARAVKDPRTPKLQAFCDAAFDPRSRYHLINGHATALRGGLTAFAGELFKREHREERGCKLPMLYLALHGRSLEMPKDSFLALAYQIWSFYHGLHERRKTGTDPRFNEQFLAPQSLDQVVTLLQATHRLMAEYPAIILFDGYRAKRFDPDTRDYSLSNLTAAIAGDRLFDLIERLILTPTPRSDGPIDVARFRLNKFIILSDEPIYSEALDGEMPQPLHPHPAARLIEGISVDIPSPQLDLLPAILASFGNQHPEQIAWIKKHIGGATDIDMVALQDAYEAHTKNLLATASAEPILSIGISESLIGVLSTMAMLGLEVPADLMAATPAEAVRVLIEDTLWPAISTRLPASEAVMLHLIAIAPGGLRPKTLARVYEHYLDAVYGFDAPVTREQINGRIETMLILCHGLVNVLRSDEHEALQGRSIPLLFRRGFSLDREEINCDRAIEFAFEEVGEIIRRQPHVWLPRGHGKEAARDKSASKDPDPGYLPFLHLLHAEEAYEQYTHLARYDDLQSEESVHRKSPLLAVVYHGAASLGEHSFKTKTLFKAGGQFLPDRPVDRWIKLFNFAFRKALDRNPQHDLVRRFDAAQTKLDLLLALARPELCYASEGQGERWQLPKILEGPSQVDETQRKKILEEFSLELRRATHAVSRQLDIEWSVPGEDEEKTDSQKLVALTEEALTLTNVPNIGDPEVDGLSAAIRGAIAGLLGISGAARDPIGKHLDFVARHVDRILRGKGSTKFIAPDLELRVFELAKIPVDRLKPLVDYLSLLGEVLGVRADRDYGAQLAMRRPGERIVPSKAVLKGFVESFSAYYVAEFLRNRIFWQDPIRGRDAIGGRAARGFIRVSLKLERFRITLARSDPSAGEDEKAAPGGWFWKHAHNMSDDFARHLSRFPRERVANLILDATMARYYESKHNDPERYAQFLAMARECLSSAEPMIIKLSMHNRLRQRFARERAKVFSESARMAISEGNFEKAQRFIDICELDIESYERIARPDDLLWKNLADWDRRTLQQVRFELDAKQRALIEKGVPS
ncbi:MAG: hypothetical protein V4574_04725 [Pseudomonadota bacterium]